MFFRERKLPEELIHLPVELISLILNYLSLTDSIHFAGVSQSIQQFINDPFIWKKFGAESFSDFASKIHFLPYQYKKSIFANEYKLYEAKEISDQLTDIINISEMFISNIESDQATYEAKLGSMQRYLIDSHPDILQLFEKLRTISDSDSAILNALKYLLMGSITLKHALNFKDITILLSLSKNEVNVLSLGLATPDQLINLPSCEYFEAMHDSNVADLLKGHFISPEQIARMPSIQHLYQLVLKDKLGLALKNKFINIEEIIQRTDLQDAKSYIVNQVCAYRTANQTNSPPASPGTALKFRNFCS